LEVEVDEVDTSWLSVEESVVEDDEPEVELADEF
jgi:hypothetical protein